MALLFLRIVSPILLGCLGLALVPNAKGQTSQFVFDVATIKQTDLNQGPNGLYSGVIESNGRLFAKRETVVDLLKWAYNLKSDLQVIGGQKWTNREHFDIEAKPSDELIAALKKLTAAEREEKLRLCLRDLLATRLKLKIHQDTRLLATYVLEKEGSSKEASLLVTSNGRKLPPEITYPGIMWSPGKAVAKQATIQQLLELLMMQQECEGRFVIDKSGLTGTYDFTLIWSPNGQDSDQPSLFTAVKEQLGLQIKPSKDAVNVIVIDNVEEPSAN
jgi:bla regulator protein BlaR1